MGDPSATSRRDAPRVSVVVPVFNGRDCVADAVGSVLAQEFDDFELIAVDDGSTDDTPQVLARFGERITVFRQANRGLPAARNAGILLSRGELLLFLDADDLWPAGYLERFVAVAEAAPGVEVFHCGWRGVDWGGRELYTHLEPLPIDADPFHDLVVTGSPHIDALMIRRRVLPRVGLFDVRLTLQEDWDFWLRLAAAGAAFRGVPENVVSIRRSPTSMSGSAGGRLALTGLAVLERQLALHPRCPACPRADQGLAAWRRVAVRSSAHHLARRLHLSGGFGRWLGLALATLRTPRLAGAAASELAAGFRRRR